MSIESLEHEFVKDGFIIIRDAISEEVISNVQAVVLAELSPQVEIADASQTSNFYKKFCSLMQRKLETLNPYDALKPVYERLCGDKLISRILLEPKVFGFLWNVLGKDLCHEDNPALTLNIPGMSSSAQNYLFKDFHQEIWSGASVNTIQFWTPIFQTQPRGGIELIPGSHLWGHIPHSNRAPLRLPKRDSIEATLKIGDVIIFHSLLVHRSSQLQADDNFRLALPCLVKNFRLENDSFEIYRNWRIFSYSTQSIINRKLGNHYLSPFRLIDVPMQRQDSFLDIEGTP